MNLMEFDLTPEKEIIAEKATTNDRGGLKHSIFNLDKVETVAAFYLHHRFSDDIDLFTGGMVTK